MMDGDNPYNGGHKHRHHQQRVRQQRLLTTPSLSSSSSRMLMAMTTMSTCLVTIGIIITTRTSSLNTVEGFLPSNRWGAARRISCHHDAQRCHHHHHYRRRLLWASSSGGRSSSNEEEEEDDEENLDYDDLEAELEFFSQQQPQQSAGPEKSSLFDYARQYLDTQQQQENVDEDDAVGGVDEIMSSAVTDDISTTVNTPTSTTMVSHLIAIPLDTCHELMIELESVQRAILYHCPVLVHACVTGSMTRLPLLYVKTPQQQQQPTQQGVISSNNGKKRQSNEITQQLQQLVQRVVTKHLIVPASASSDERGALVDEDELELEKEELDKIKRIYGGGEEDVGDDDGGRTAETALADGNGATGKDLESANKEGTKPFMLSFEKLEIDGRDNSVLLTTAKESDPATSRLQAMVQELQQTIKEQYGWETMLPHDPQQQQQKEQKQEPDGTAASTNDQTTGVTPATNKFRPRVPFMRLPTNWTRNYLDISDSLLSTTDEDDAEDNNVVDYDAAYSMIPSDKGGNGISPIFWCSWWDDEFGKARMPQVAIYERQQHASRGNDDNAQTDDDMAYLREQSFTVPSCFVALPLGNDALTKVETKFEKYQEERMLEAYAQLVDDQPSEEQQEEQELLPDNDMLLSKTRERLETLYRQEPDVLTGEIVEDKAGVDEPADGAIGEFDFIDAEEEEEDEDDIDDDDNDSNNAASPVKVEHSPPNEGNSSGIDDWTRQRIVANRAKLKAEKELAQKKDKPSIASNPVFTKYKEGTLVPDQGKTSTTPQRELPPFPSRDYCVGFWRVIQSPTGFAVEEGQPDRSDNLILRVDGTTAGGPILDQDTRQKACGGTWRLATELKDETNNSTELRIRLIIPPQKDRIMVLQGKLERASFTSDLPLTRSTFGIPSLEERAAKASSDMEDLLYCSGNVWIEDAVTKKNRQEIGEFSIMKLDTPTDPKEYTITVPRPIRNQD